MALPALLAALVASSSASAPAPAIVWIKADGNAEIVRVAFLGFDVDRAPQAPETLNGVLHYGGRTTPVTMRRKWQGIDAARGGWVPADYRLDVPRAAVGDAVLSLGGGEGGWSFRVAER